MVDLSGKAEQEYYWKNATDGPSIFASASRLLGGQAKAVFKNAANKIPTFNFCLEAVTKPVFLEKSV